MSSVLNRSTSMMNGGEMYLGGATGEGGSGDGGGGGVSLRESIVGVLGARHLRESPTSSPLQIFVRAKKKINDIYQEIEEYVAETTHFLEGKLLMLYLLNFIVNTCFKLKLEMYIKQITVLNFILCFYRGT